MKKIIFILLAISAISCKNSKVSTEQTSAQQVKDTIYEYGIPVSEFEMVEGEVKKGDFFSTLMISLGAGADETNRLTEASKGVFDLKKIKIGNKFKAFYTPNEERELAYLIYFNDKKTFVTFNLFDTIDVSVTELETRVTRKITEASISSSLWDDIIKTGASPVLASRLSEIYAWSIDFFALRKGDSFTVIYDEIYVGDQFFDIGDIYAADFVHSGKLYKAYRFVVDSVTGYWSETGENLKKAFLKAPLSFTRVSSRFTYSRRHPVTRIVRPHTGVDYAAPKGTPVMSIGDGVVVQKGYAGGGGNTVKIKHNGTYTSAYLHLSAYGKGISKGARVSQGQIIGFVGSTGLSTGPHLDFRVWRNGTPVDPLKMESPPAKKIESKDMESFQNYIANMEVASDSLKAALMVDRMVGVLGKR